ncbi:YhdP family protein [Motiliproteus sediminis]|uniref:YhdP family protein n=1 Tax=Motiliproteus sediminis TaxID=1468178 RepID=UPI001AEFDDE0|nr:YhdP family protein [Motiliproteus sediminis]
MATLLHFPLIRHLLRWLLLPLLLLLALILTLGRLSMASVDHYRAELEQLMSERGPYPVRIGKLQGGWHILSPTLTASRLLVGDENIPALRLDKLEMELDLLASLWNRRPVARRLLLDGLDLAVWRNHYGDWQLAGAGAVAGQSAEEADLMPILQSLWLQREVAIRNARLQVTLQDRDVAMPVQQLELAWQHRGDRQRLYARLGLDDEAAITLRGASSGRLGTDEFRGSYHLRTSMLAPELLAALLPEQPPHPMELGLTTELWAEVEGHQQWVGGTLSLPRLVWRRGDSSLRVDDLMARIQLAHQADGNWHAQLDAIQGRLSDAPLGVGDLSLWGNGTAVNGLATKAMALEPVWQQLQSLPLLNAALRERLSPLSPKGTLRNLRLSRPEGAEWSAWSLDADLDQVAVGAWHGAPEARNVSGRLRVDAEGGRVDLDSHAFWLNFPELYRQGWQFERANGAVSWRLDEDRVRIESQLLSLGSREVNANGRFAIDIPRAAVAADDGRLVLMIGMRDSNGALAPLFVPDRILDPALFRWLEGALNEGVLHSGGLVYDAPLRRSDSVDRQPTLQMFFDTGATRLRYQSGWPAVEDADAFTLIKNSEVLVDIPRGRVYDQTRIERAEVYLPPKSHRLEVRARLNGPAADGRLALLESPIGAKLGEEFERWEVMGELHTELNLGLDLDAFERSSIRVDSHVSQGEYWSRALNLRIEEINGSVHFDETQGLYSGVISGRFFDRPLVAQIDTEGQGAGATTRIRGWGGITMNAVRRWTGLPLMDAFAGETDYAFELDICGERPGCSGLRLDSKLLGVVVDAPAPFAKRGGEAAPFSLELDLTPGYQWLKLSYPQLDGLLALQAGELRGGELSLGRDYPQLQPRTDGIAVHVAVDDIELDQWQAFIEHHLLAGRSLTDTEPAPADAVQLVDLDLRSNRVSYQGRQLHAVDARIQQQGPGWRLNLNSRELEGVVILPKTSGQVVVAELERLYLPSADADQSEADPLLDYDPRQLPRVDFRVADLRRGDESYGRWQFKLRPDQQGARFLEVQSDVRGLKLGGELYWAFDGSGHQTEARIDAEAANLGDVMAAWGSARSLETESARFAGTLRWQGSPAGFDWNSLAGSSSFHAERGQILDTGDRPVLKLFSLVNVSTLLRRLSLDFKDLTTEGTFFDSMDFELALSAGVASTTQPATLISPTYDLELEGDVDLGREQLDLTMLVQLPVAENLPIAAALLASPAIAGAVFLVERLIGKQLKRFTSVRYQLSGPWESPAMELISKPEAAQPDRTRPLDADL